MTEHRALQAIKAAKSKILLLPTEAGANVMIGRTTDSFEEDAIDLRVGPDTPPNEFGTDNIYTIDSVQRVYIDLIARSQGDQEAVTERVFELRTGVHRALLADPKLGLSWVISTRYLGTDEFEDELRGDYIGAMRTVWDIAYRMEYSDPAT